MNKRKLGMTGLMVSEIGFGGEWLARHPEEESIQLIKYASSKGINILDCWMPDPKSRNIIGEGIKDNRSEWFIGATAMRVGLIQKQALYTYEVMRFFTSRDSVLTD